MAGGDGSKGGGRGCVEELEEKRDKVAKEEVLKEEKLKEREAQGVEKEEEVEKGIK